MGKASRGGPVISFLDEPGLGLLEELDAELVGCQSADAERVGRVCAPHRMAAGRMRRSFGALVIAPLRRWALGK